MELVSLIINALFPHRRRLKVECWVGLSCHYKGLNLTASGRAEAQQPSKNPHWVSIKILEIHYLSSLLLHWLHCDISHSCLFSPLDLNNFLLSFVFIVAYRGVGNIYDQANCERCYCCYLVFF